MDQTRANRTTVLSDDARGQTGVGTLIVFIAVILVATIAAAVLIDTAGVLQVQASDTSSDTQEVVTSRIDVVYAGGVVDENDEYVTALNLTVKVAGTQSIDLTSATVQYTSDRSDRALTYDDAGGFSGADGSAQFLTRALVGDGEVLTDENDRAEVMIDVSAIEDGSGLEPGDTVTLRLVGPTGGQTTYRVSVPRTLENEDTVEV